MKNLYVACMGGSGMRVANSLVYLAAAGMFGTMDENQQQREFNIKLLIVDAHAQHPDVNKARSVIGEYSKLRKLFNSSGRGSLFSTNIEMFEWDMLPVSEGFEDRENMDLNRLAAVGKNGKECSREDRRNQARRLVEALYSKDERELQVYKKGYNARPTIGAAFCTSAIKINDGSENGFERFKKSIGESLQVEEKTHLVLVGSLFGGTGASCLSSLVRNFKELGDESGHGELLIAGMFMLPYFSFGNASGDIKDSFIIDQSVFEYSSKIALDYYNDQKLLKSASNPNGIYDAIYLAGFDDPTPQAAAYNNNDDQRNPAHFLEMEAAMGIYHFISDAAQQSINNNHRVFFKGMKLHKPKKENSKPYYNLEWSTLTGGSQLRSKVGDFLRMGFYFTGHDFPRIFDRNGQFNTRLTIAFLRDTFDQVQGANLHTQLNLLHSFFVRYMTWCLEVAKSVDDAHSNSKLFSWVKLDDYLRMMAAPELKYSDGVLGKFLSNNYKSLVIGPGKETPNLKGVTANPSLGAYLETTYEKVVNAT